MSIWNWNLNGILYSRDSRIFLIKGHSKFPQFPMKDPEVEETELDGRGGPQSRPPLPPGNSYKPAGGGFGKAAKKRLQRGNLLSSGDSKGIHCSKAANVGQNCLWAKFPREEILNHKEQSLRQTSNIRKD